MYRATTTYRNFQPKIAYFPEEGLAEEGLAEEGLAEEGLAEEGFRQHSWFVGKPEGGSVVVTKSA
ncbi:unnamed protein product [Fusarium graminearum]|nr:unnamed protein product [Fusarium graminearum]